ncbi:MAG: hypothetical protein ABH846_00175 [Patescibacteria group bacterium]
MKKMFLLFGVAMLLGAGCTGSSSGSDGDLYLPTDLPSDVQEVYYDFSKLEIAADDDNCTMFLAYHVDYSGITTNDCPAAFEAFADGLADDIDWEQTSIEDENAFIYTYEEELLTMMVLEDGDWLSFEDFWTPWMGWNE